MRFDAVTANNAAFTVQIKYFISKNPSRCVCGLRSERISAIARITLSTKKTSTGSVGADVAEVVLPTPIKLVLEEACAMDAFSDAFSTDASDSTSASNIFLLGLCLLSSQRGLMRHAMAHSADRAAR
jgi:hypothetical protein